MSGNSSAQRNRGQRRGKTGSCNRLRRIRDRRQTWQRRGCCQDSGTRNRGCGLDRSRRPTLPQAQPRQHRAGQEDGREDHRVDRRPTEIFQQLAGGKRCDGHAAENQEVVERLHLVAFLGPVALRHHGGGADEGEVPAEAEQHQRGPEMRHREAGYAGGRGEHDQAQADAGDALDAEARDQPAGEEARRIHRQHVPLDAERGVVDRMAAADHGERRRGHQHVHHGVARHAAGDGDDEARHAHDLAQRPRVVGVHRRQRRNLDEHQHQRGDDGAGRLAEIAGGEGIGRQTGPW